MKKKHGSDIPYTMAGVDCCVQRNTTVAIHCFKQMNNGNGTSMIVSMYLSYANEKYFSSGDEKNCIRRMTINASTMITCWTTCIKMCR